MRDKIPGIIQKNGDVAKTHTADDEEYLKALFTKLVEEATELMLATDYNHQKEEFADAMEVMESIQKVLGFTDAEILSIKTKKRTQRGGFDKRIILERNTQ